MNNFPQQPPPPQGIKKQWIILGAVIGVLVLVMGGCVACAALIGLSSLSNQNTAETDTNVDDSEKPRRSSGPSSSGSGSLAGTTWTGTSNCDDGDKIEMSMKFADSGNPIYEYQTSSGPRSVELSEPGQSFRYVPPGGGVRTVTMDSVEVSSDRASHTMSVSFERTSGGTLDQSRASISTEAAITDGELEVETRIRSQSVTSQPGIMVPGDENVVVCRGRLKRE